MKHIASLILLTTFAAGCAQPPPEPPPFDVSAELAGLEQTRSAFMAALKEGRYQDIGGLVSPDLMAVPPGSDDWGLMFKLGESRGTPFPYDSIAMRPMETVVVSDSIAWDMGNSTVYFTNEDGEVQELTNTFLAILKKGSDGRWKLHREVASSMVAGGQD